MVYGLDAIDLFCHGADQPTASRPFADQGVLILLKEQFNGTQQACDLLFANLHTTADT
jgi:hypothetical protein